MKNRIITKKTIALLVAILTGTTPLMQAQNVNLDNKVVITVVQGEQIRIDLKADNEGTPVRIVSGSNTQDITVGPSATGARNYLANSTTMTIYGDISGFGGNGNGSKITALDASGHTKLTQLYCVNNAITSLNVSGASQLTLLYCQRNAITSLDVSGLARLEKLEFWFNAVSSINASGTTALKEVFCDGNQLDACDLDDLFRMLPNRLASDNARLYIKDGPSSNPGAENCRTPIANAKNWQVMDFNGDLNNSSIIDNTNFACPNTGTELVSTVALALYPNPVMEVLQVQAEGDVRSVRVYNIYGVEVATASNAKHINLAHLPAGAYTVVVETDNGIGRSKVIKQ